MVEKNLNEGSVSVWAMDKAMWKECQGLMKVAKRSLNREIEAFVRGIRDQLKGQESQPTQALEPTQTVAVDQKEEAEELPAESNITVEPIRSGEAVTESKGVMDHLEPMLLSLCYLLGFDQGLVYQGGKLDLNPLFEFAKNASEDQLNKVTDQFLVKQDRTGRGKHARRLLAFFEAYRKSLKVESNNITNIPGNNANNEKTVVEKVEEKPSDILERIASFSE